MRSIRTTLLIGTIAGVVLVIVVAGVVLHRAVRTTLVDQFDRALADKARLLASTLEVDGDAVEVEFDELDMREFESPEEPGYLQLWLSDGTVLYRSPSLGEGDLQRLTGQLDQPVFQWVSVGGAANVRAVGLSALPRIDNEEDEAGEEKSEDAAGGARHTVGLVLARTTSDIDAFLGRVRTLLILTGFLAGLIAVVVLGTVIRRGLRPLDELAGKITDLGDNDLSSRIELGRAPRELVPVVRQLNDLLDRLEKAFYRERTFTADVAHELRTPLAGLRSTLEVAASRPRQSEQYQETLVESLDVVCRIQDMVQRLLCLCRFDAGQIELEEKRTDLSELVRTAWQPLAAAAEDRELHIEWALSPDVFVRTDPMYLELAIRNVLENAVIHSNEGGDLSVSVNGGQQRADIRVVNSGSGVTPEQVQDLTERFSRGDNARTDAGAHPGLGLALVEKISSLLRCSVDIQSRDGGQFIVTLSMSRAG